MINVKIFNSVDLFQGKVEILTLHLKAIVLNSFSTTKCQGDLQT